MSAPDPACWCEVSTGDMRWWVEPRVRDSLIGPGGLRLEEWLQSGQATIVKQGPHRAVYRVELAAGQFVYVKHNLLPDCRAWLRQMVRPSKARMELERARAVAARGVSTAVPLALGERQTMMGACDSYLVTRSLEGTQTLNSFLATTLAPMRARRHALVRRRLAEALGRFVAQMHEAGIRHDDLHAANILVHLTGDDHLLLYLIDLNAVQLGRRLLWPASRDNLVLLTRWFVPRTSRADRLRFWRTYYEARRQGVWPRGCHGPREHFVQAREVEERARASMVAFWKNRDKRCFADNRYFRSVRGPGLIGHAIADFDAKLLAMLVANPDAPFQQAGVRMLKESRSSAVAEFQWIVDGVPRPLIYKRFRLPRWTDTCAALLRPPAALRSWMFGHGFRERCLGTARPLAVLHRTRAGLLSEGYLLTEKIDKGVDLHAFFVQLAQLPAPLARGRLRQTLDAVARAVRQMHRCRLSHRDLKGNNVFIANNQDRPHSPFLPLGAAGECASISSLLPLPASPVWFIDLAGVRLHSHLHRSRRVQNLVRLHASFHQSHQLTRTDKLRFLRGYLLWNLVGQGAWKTWWKAIDRATAGKIARNKRRGRVLG